jgi:hypothetical protein
MSMRPHEIVASLRIYADAMAQAAVTKASDGASRSRLNFGASLLFETADLVLQLQTRLVQQAVAYEHGEAANARRWPLLEDDDTDPGAAL